MSDNKKLAEMIDHNRWLLNSGLVNDMTKNNLFLYGSIVNKEVKAVDMSIEVASKLVKYDIYVPKFLFAKIESFHKLTASDGLFAAWKLRRLYKKFGNLDFQYVIDRFVRDYCGKDWSARVTVKDYASYLDGYGDKDNTKDVDESFVEDKKPHQ